MSDLVKSAFLIIFCHFWISAYAFNHTYASQIQFNTFEFLMLLLLDLFELSELISGYTMLDFYILGISAEKIPLKTLIFSRSIQKKSKI